jgi:hypothetical protein
LPAGWFARKQTAFAAPEVWIIHDDDSTVRQTNKISRPAKEAAEKVIFDCNLLFQGLKPNSI